MKTIIFDIGNVLLKFNPRKYLSERYNKEQVDLVLSELFITNQWHGLDRGDFTDVEMLDAIEKRHPENIDLFKEIYRGWVDMLKPIEDNIEVAKTLKEKGYTLLLLSNFSKTGFAITNRAFDFFTLFDGGVISYEVNACKPEEIIYDQLIFQYGLNPKECIFIDDLAKNIDAAMAKGMEGIWFTEDTNLEEILRKKGIL